MGGGGVVGAIFDFKMEDEAGFTKRFTSCPQFIIPIRR